MGSVSPTSPLPRGRESHEWLRLSRRRLLHRVLVLAGAVLLILAIQGSVILGLH